MGEKYEKSKPAAQAELTGKNRAPALSYLRYVLELEELTRFLREDLKAREAQVQTEVLSSSERKRVLDMRDRENLERITNIVDPPRRGPAVRDQEKLAKAHLSKF